MRNAMVKILIAALVSSGVSLNFGVAANAAVPSCSSVSMTGTAIVGNTLTAVVSGCSNTPTSFNYRWLASKDGGATYSVIPSATSSTLSLSSAEGARKIHVEVAPENSSGVGAFTRSSSATATVLFVPTLYAGNSQESFQDGPALSARFHGIQDIDTDGENLFIADLLNYRIRQIDSSGNVSTIAGDGTSALVNGQGTSATFARPEALAYEPATDSLFIKDDGKIRIMSLATGQVTSMQNSAEVASYSQSLNNVTLTFDTPHGFEKDTVITVTGLDAIADGQQTITFVADAVTLRYAVSTSRTLASTPVNGAKIVGDMGAPLRNDWFTYYGFTVSPDGHLYMGRANSGRSTSESYVIRFVRLSGDVFRYERLFKVNASPTDIAFLDSETMIANTGSNITKFETTNDWATRTATVIKTPANDGAQVVSGYVYYQQFRYDPNASAFLETQYMTAISGARPDFLVPVGNDVYFAQKSDERIFKIEGIAGDQAVDTIPPVIASSVPINAATGVDPGADIVINFDENVVAATGKVRILRSSDNSLVSEIDIADGQVTISGNQLTLNPTASLPEGISLTLEITAGAVEDSSGNAFVGLSAGTIAFTTADVTAPTLISSVPANNGTAVPDLEEISLAFSEPVTLGTATSGQLALYLASDDSLVENFDISDANVVTAAGSTVTIAVSVPLVDGESYYLTAPATAFEDAASNAFAGLAQNALVFSVAVAASSPAPFTGPVVSLVNPNPAQAGQSVVLSGSNLGGIRSISVDGHSIAVAASSTSASLVLPADVRSGTWNIVLSGDFGTLTVQDAITVTDQFQQITADSTSSFWTKRTGNSVKVYAKDVVGAGKVQFMHEGREFAWVRAVDQTNPKLRAANGSYYLVRTYVLKPGKNAFEIYLDSERVWRAAYTQR